jgi:prophage regulatory protein
MGKRSVRLKKKPCAVEQDRKHKPVVSLVAAQTIAGPALLLEHEVVERVRLSRCTIWRLEKVGRFPKRVKIGFKRVAWRAAEIDAWIAGAGEKTAA